MPADVALLTLADGTAVLQHPPARASALVAAVVETVTFDLDARSDIPDAPPPRA
jgi:hypothetical protein